MRCRRKDATPFVTKDGSVIRELMHPAVHANVAQSLAEARLAAGDTTRLHRHRLSEELYHVLEGHGRMTLGEERFPIEPGDTVHIAPGMAHRLENTGTTPLRILCCSTPPYADSDTELIDPEPI